MNEKARGASQELSHEDISQLWAKYRGGEMVRCPRGDGGISLSVDGAAKAYRMVCTQCGLASPWFGTTPTGLVFRSAPQTVNPASSSGTLSDD
ncbi:MAG: hypothetical protein KC657_18410 [Myxococcales bacterium]|nr:hypothetical protein [Myxococcales bacterium]